MIKKIFFTFLALIFMAGCSKNPEINKDYKTSLENHQHIKQDIIDNSLDKADNDFMSLEADFPTSMYIKSDLLSLFLAHLNNQDFELTKFYLNQYEKRYASIQEIPWCEYQKIKINFSKYQNAYTNQKELLDLISQCKLFKSTYPKSIFMPEVNTIYIKAVLTKQYLNDKIKKLYIKLGEKKASQKFKADIPKDSIPPHIPWYKKLFYW